MRTTTITDLRLVVLLLIAAGCTEHGRSPLFDAREPACALADMTGDLGTRAALKAQRCPVSGSFGTQKWFRLSATMKTGDVVQLELWPGKGPFSGAVTTGTFPIDTTFGSCGVCLRAIGDHGTASQMEYFGAGGMVNITALSGPDEPFSATVSDASLAEVDTSKQPVLGGCTATLARVQINGTVTDMTGGGGGGGGGSGNGPCPFTVGD